MYSKQLRKHNQPSTQMNSSSKGVTFSETVTVREIPKLLQGEAGALRYLPQDYRGFQAKNQTIVMLMKSSASDRSVETVNGESTRGLECLLRENRRRSLVLRRESLLVVFEEQELQWINNIDDPETVAHLYSQSCQRSKEAALFAGRRDEKHIRELYLEKGNIDPRTRIQVLKALSPESRDKQFVGAMRRKQLRRLVSAAA
jgi:hypothetical protein